MISKLTHITFVLALLLFSGNIVAQIVLKSGATIYFGSATTTTAPASIEESKVLDATPEFQRIKKEGIKEESAQYKLLESSARDRIRKAVKDVATTRSKDLVTRDTDIEDAKGRTVVDITTEVINAIVADLILDH